ncbi:MAG: heparinase II/III family protein [Anaerolineales bacterium]|nr:heparinase II/III family protein [Anaerolineales bacterium]
MLKRIKNLASLLTEQGLRWSAFRFAYAFRLRSGLMRWQTPQYAWDERPLASWLKAQIPSAPQAYAAWRKVHAPKFFFNSDINSQLPAERTQPAIEEADKLLNGEVKFFANQFRQIGFPPNWNFNGTPSADDAGKHWSQISDDSESDVKFTWEPNRFAFVYALVRAYAATKDEKYPRAFWQLIEDWAQKNPPNTGANWMDGQEIALRLMAWTFGYYAFFDFASAEQISKFTVYVAAQAERIEKNIGYAISTRSNHTVSEAFGLWLVGLLFPELQNAEKYFSRGKKLLEDEAQKQIFPDGGYAMYSLNYHRFILHLYLYAIQLGKINQSPFTNYLITSIFNSINYLSRLINPVTGQMPVYGSNDGALVLPLNNCDFTDYRPLLQLGAWITQNNLLFESGAWDEDLYWICDLAPNPSPSRRGERLSFPAGGRAGDEENNQVQESGANHSGVYILRGENSRAFVRCTRFVSRPSHADQLHLDLWIGDENIAVDAGTYLYSGAGTWRNGLARAFVHNTVTVDGRDQMMALSRFTWTRWAQGKALTQTENFWQGEHDGYKPIRHRRSVMALDGDRWLIADDLAAKTAHRYTLHWLLGDGKCGVEEGAPQKGASVDFLLLNYVTNSKTRICAGVMQGDAQTALRRADANSTYGWRSRYYAHKEPAFSLTLEVNQPVVRFWTFFGKEGDLAALRDSSLFVNDAQTNLPP